MKQDPFNSFYSTLIRRLCDEDRQHKLTLQYAIWDFMKQFSVSAESSSSSSVQISPKRIMNLGRMCGEFVGHFELSLSFLKICDMSWLSNTNCHLFLSTMLLHLLSPQKTSQDRFEGCVGRLIENEGDDSPVIHGILVLFLKENLPIILSSLPSSKEEEEENNNQDSISKSLKKRGKWMIKTLSKLKQRKEEENQNQDDDEDSIFI